MMEVMTSPYTIEAANSRSPYVKSEARIRYAPRLGSSSAHGPESLRKTAAQCGSVARRVKRVTGLRRDDIIPSSCALAHRDSGDAGAQLRCGRARVRAHLRPDGDPGTAN